MARKTRLVFLDRDGTLIEERGFLSDPRGVRLVRGAAGAVERLNRAGWAVVIVTNQSGVARGYYSLRQMRAVNRRVVDLLRQKGAVIDAVEFCPHHPEAKRRIYRRNCSCRKPEPGMALRAARRLGIPLRGCVAVGDRLADVELAGRLKGAGVLVLTGYGKEHRALAEKRGLRPAAVVRDLPAAVDWILRRAPRPLSRA